MPSVPFPLVEMHGFAARGGRQQRFPEAVYVASSWPRPEGQRALAAHSPGAMQTLNCNGGHRL